MPDLTQKTPLTSQRYFRRTGDDPAWLWWFVMGGSIALHLLLLKIALPIASGSSPRPQAAQSIPVDLIELAPAPSKPASTKPAANPASFKAPAATTETAQRAGQSAPSPVRSQPQAAPLSESDIALAPSPSAIRPTPIAPAPAAETVTPPAPTASPAARSLNPAPATTPEQPLPLPSVAAAPVALPSPTVPEQPLPLPSVTAAPVALPTPTPSATPTSPPFTTLTIDTPVPDVSGTLAIPSTAANPADLAQVEASRLAVPALLTAQITATPMPAEQPETMPDTIARPKDESQTFSADPTTSLCRITPEAARYLGSTVAVQVVTNETGQVTEAIVRQSSQNSAYDELATCMVKQWQFEPATKQGQPVQSDALIVAIRIS